MRRVQAQLKEDQGRWAVPIPFKRDKKNRRNEFTDVSPNKNKQSQYITGEAGSAQKKTETSPRSAKDNVGDLPFGLGFN